MNFYPVYKQNGKAMGLMLCLLVILFASCSSPDIVMVKQDASHQVDPNKPHKYLFFVQSNNQINSRVAMDECVRLSESPSLQGYLYTKGEPINTGNREMWRNKMSQDGFDYVVVLRLTDTATVPTFVSGEGNVSTRSFYGDYSTQIEPYAYNPGYERENKLFLVETNVYFVETDKLVWSCQSKVYNPTDVNDAVKQTAKAVVKKMKRSGFMK
jgi:hypothetical protein